MYMDFSCISIVPHIHAIGYLVKRYAPPVPCQTVHERQKMGIAMVLTCIGFGEPSYYIYLVFRSEHCLPIGIQFYVGIICLFALFRTKRKSNSTLTGILLCHTIALALTNLACFITALIGYIWCLGEHFVGKWWLTFLAANVTFIISRFLIDGVLVSSFTHSTRLLLSN